MRVNAPFYCKAFFDEDFEFPCGEQCSSCMVLELIEGEGLDDEEDEGEEED